VVAEAIAKRLGGEFTVGSDDFELAEGQARATAVFVVKPLTFMNNSGLAVRQLLKRYRIPLEHLLVIHDDINLPFGRIRLRGKGSDGGHNGLASIIRHLSTQEFPRLRVGVGADFGPGEMVDYVLSKFDRHERGELGGVVDRATDASLTFIASGVEAAMNRYNMG
jgi:PTH1 family peptidyl-tRNA hydrolase